MRVVVKYGGSSVATIDKIKEIADYIIKLKKEKYNEIVIVASAMGKMTDELIKKATEFTDKPSARELDSLLSTGEQQSVALLAIALQSKGQDAISLTGAQVKIETTGIHTKSKIKNICVDRIEKHLSEGKIVLIAGFQGVNEYGDITTLGRGGSDTTAVGLAARLKCECRIYTDVDGIYNIDPRVYQDAKPLKYISYEEMMEMAHLGAGVMEPRAVEIGQKYSVPIFVGKSLSDEGGTYIMEKSYGLEDKLITGISVIREILVATVSNIEYSSEKTAEIFSIAEKYGLNVNMIIQNVNNNKLEISFSIPFNEKNLLDHTLEEIKNNYPNVDVKIDDNLGMISVVGVGMANNSGVAGKFFSALSNANINFYQVTTSEISISCSVEKKNINKAVEVTAKEFSI
ncbi:aspartate kinase [Fusobacterium sp. PH5-44]|uniref:aspartate kinase n=1 Tax=unclassified Fusobacterium TaxID=2648384 RepID=UPI003D19F453